MCDGTCAIFETEVYSKAVILLNSFFGEIHYPPQHLSLSETDAELSDVIKATILEMSSVTPTNQESTFALNLSSASSRVKQRISRESSHCSYGWKIEKMIKWICQQTWYWWVENCIPLIYIQMRQCKFCMKFARRFRLKLRSKSSTDMSLDLTLIGCQRYQGLQYFVYSNRFHSFQMR